MVFGLSIVGVAVSAALFAAATHGVDAPRPEAAVRPRQAVSARFFGADDAIVVRPVVPIEVLLLQIERHVSLEQAAGESFLHAPTPQSLHARSASPLMN